MDKQISMSFFTDELAEVKTHKNKGERGNKPYGLELMLRIYVLQMVYNVADMAAAAEVIDSRVISQYPDSESTAGEALCRYCQQTKGRGPDADEGHDR